MHMNMMHTEGLRGNMIMILQGRMSMDILLREMWKQSIHMISVMQIIR